MPKKKYCVYSLWKGPRKQRIGKGEFFKSAINAEEYLEKRYGQRRWWNRFSFGPCFVSEEAAYDEERRQIKTYQRSHEGKLPPHNKVAGGGGPRKRKKRK